jgi:hypothetical protein
MTPTLSFAEFPVGEGIVLDADGVLVDYNRAYPGAWFKAFGEQLMLTKPDAYHAHDRWSAPILTDEKALAHLRAAFVVVFWETMVAMPGAVEACHALAVAGVPLICVSALPAQYEAARLRNLKALGFPIAHVVAAPERPGTESPKAEVLRILRPRAFVDDFLPYFRGVPRTTHLALIQRELEGSPNTGAELTDVHSSHPHLLHFSKFWLDRA